MEGLRKNQEAIREAIGLEWSEIISLYRDLVRVKIIKCLNQHEKFTRLKTLKSVCNCFARSDGENGICVHGVPAFQLNDFWGLFIKDPTFTTRSSMVLRDTVEILVRGGIISDEEYLYIQEFWNINNTADSIQSYLARGFVKPKEIVEIKDPNIRNLLDKSTKKLSWKDSIVGWFDETQKTKNTKCIEEREQAFDAVKEWVYQEGQKIKQALIAQMELLIPDELFDKSTTTLPQIPKMVTAN